MTDIQVHPHILLIIRLSKTNEMLKYTTDIAQEKIKSMGLIKCFYILKMMW